ncbi:MAG: hypothetical protein WC374_02985 [Phycisphaerae bacterium]
MRPNSHISERLRCADSASARQLVILQAVLLCAKTDATPVSPSFSVDLNGSNDPTASGWQGWNFNASAGTIGVTVAKTFGDVTVGIPPQGFSFGSRNRDGIADFTLTDTNAHLNSITLFDRAFVSDNISVSGRTLLAACTIATFFAGAKLLLVSRHILTRKSMFRNRL